uniref:GRF-type domain-containing protein n=1 Tax=Brassica oleracea var. oleracea TaxID=109376 RepID=A0A0D3AE64_BRAOL
MAGGRSNTSGDSRGSSSGRRPSRGAGRFFSVPKKCWSGELMVTLTSNSDQNPYRRYLRCSFAAENKLQNDNHIFKWVDEALLNEVDTLLLIFCVFYSSRD